MKRRFDITGLSIIGSAVVLALIQWVAAWQDNSLPSAFEFVQSFVLIPVAVLYVGYLTVRESNSVGDFIARYFTSRANLPVPATILAYLSTTWFSGFHEKYDAAVWQNGIALKGFWLGAIANSKPSPTNPFPNVAYSFWGNTLQWMVDHSVYSWFGYVVIASEIVVALAFITVIFATLSRVVLVTTAIGTLVALTYHFFFLMSGSAGVNALMPYLTAIAAITLISSTVARTPQVIEVAPRIELETIAVAGEKVTSNGRSREPISIN